MRTGNPTLNAKTFSSFSVYDEAKAMTVQGTANKSFILLALVLFTSVWAWSNPIQAMPLLFPAIIGGVVFALITVFKKEWSPVTAPIYALIEGVILGAVSVFFEKSYPGIVMQAVGLTFGVFFALLVVYKSGMIKVTDNFRLGVFAATGGIFLYYLVSMVIGFFGIQAPLIHDSGPLGIGFSVVVVIIAALNLVLDFDFIERGAVRRVPKYMEWYAAFGLLVTLIWLYMEILRLLAKARRR